MDDVRFDRLLQATYESTLDPSGWQTFLDVLTVEFHAGLVGFVHQDLASKHDAVSIMSGIDEAGQREYESVWAPQNVWIGGAADRIVSGIVMTGQMMCPDSTLRRSEMWNEFFRPRDLFHLIGGCIALEGSRSSNYTIIRPERAGAYGDDDVALLQRLMPHLQRAVRIHTRLAGIDRGRDVVAEVADRVAEAFLLLDETGAVLFANAAAESLLAEKDGIAWDGRRLRAARPDATAALRTLARDGTGLLSLPRPSGRRPLVALAAPVLARSSGTWLAGPRPATVLFLRDPEVELCARADVLAATFGLTAAEARLAVAIAAGTTLEEHAASQHVTVHTVRSQLKAVFDKTGTHRQAQLVRVVMATAGPVGGH
jgi:DNA-binding CsgD family transcriptional regulator